MKCPNCSDTLLMTERHEVEIDYCPSCRGVWLDKGELDKMLEYVEQKYARTENKDQQNGKHHYYDDYKGEHKYDQKYDPKYDPKYNKHHKKKGFLGDLFDFD